jgi:hypothetical protein
MSTINRNLLRIMHITLSRRATLFKYNEFPTTLPSLSIKNPSKIQINEDLDKINSHFQHPVFKNFVPTHSEMSKNPTLAWMQRYGTFLK